jgi:hypothetical protein
VGNTAIFPQIQIPVEGLGWQVVLTDPLEEQFVGRHSLTTADDLAVALRGEDIDAEREIGSAAGRVPCRRP